MAVIHAVPDQKEFRVELSCRGFPDANLELWAQLASLRMVVQELSETKTLPPVVLLAAGASDFTVAIKSRVVGSLAVPEVICQTSSIAAAETEFRDKLKTTNIVEFTTDEDRPGLLAEVTELLKVHGANILRAEVSTAQQSAKHVYEVQDASTRGRLSDRALERLEKDFRTLRDARSPVRRATRRVAKGTGGVAAPEITSEAEGVTGCLVRITWPLSGGPDPFQAAIAANEVVSEIQSVLGLPALPSLEIRFAKTTEILIEVLGSKRGKTEFSQVLAAGATVGAVQTAFMDKFGKFSTVMFSTSSDRPGLLAECTELIRQHGANILQASISVETGTSSARHSYRVEDAETRSRLSKAQLQALTEDFVILRDAAPSARQMFIRSASPDP